MALLDLPKEINDKVLVLKRAGDNFQMGHKNLKAVEKYQAAYELLPEPKNSWKYGSIIPFMIAENYFLNAFFSEKNVGKKRECYNKALEYLAIVMSIPSNVGDGGNHLRIGQIRYELGEFEKAKDEFMRAYMAR